MDQHEPVGAGDLDAEGERVPDRHQDAEEHERDEDRQQREGRAELPAPDVLPDERKKFHAWSLVSTPFSRWIVRRARSAACGSCVTMTMVLPWSRLSDCSRSRISSPALRSRSPVGSSHSSSVGIGDDGARDADALLLAARQLTRIVLGAIRQPDDLQRDARALLPLRLRELREQQRQLDVLLGRQHGQQVVELEDEPDVLRAPLRELAAAEGAHRHAVHFDGAAGRRVEAADQIEQRRLAGSRRSHQREEIALRNLQVHALEHVDALAAAGEMFVDVFDANEFICQCHCYRFVGSVRL